MSHPRYSRSRHRAQNHHAAHADTGTAPPPAATMDHPLVPRGQAPLVTTGEELAELIDHLRESKRFAYDSEFIGEMTYVPKLCVIQVASASRVALIDPLVPSLDLGPFWDLLCDPAVEKIVHAGQQDIEPVHRLRGRAAANVFDTQVAAGFVALPYPVSLSKLVLELAGAKLGKGLTFSHWDQRPLSAMQLRYAADDVRYLPLVRAEIGARLAANSHETWAKEECESICDPSQYGFNADVQYTRVRGAGSLEPQGLAILRELTVWRDAAARDENVPARTLLKDEILIDLARSPVKSVEKLDRVRGLPRPVEAQHGPTIVEAILRALAQPASSMPRQRDAELPPGERFRADQLWAEAQTMCYEQQIDPALVSSRQEIGELYRTWREGQPADALHIMTGWRREACGQRLIDALEQRRR